MMGEMKGLVHRGETGASIRPGTYHCVPFASFTYRPRLIINVAVHGEMKLKFVLPARGYIFPRTLDTIHDSLH